MLSRNTVCLQSDEAVTAFDQAGSPARQKPSTCTTVLDEVQSIATPSILSITVLMIPISAPE